MVIKTFFQMKRIITSVFLLINLLLSAQFTLFYDEGNMSVTNGDIVTISDNNITSHFTVTNTNISDIKLKFEVLNLINTDGTEMIQLCFGVNGNGNCYINPQIGDIHYGGANLAPNASTRHGDIDFVHFDNNQNQGFNNYPKDYIFKISALDPNNNDAELSSITFTYRYDPGAGAINTFNKSDIVISTAHRHTIIIDSKYVAHVNLFNLTGQKVKEVTLKPDQNHIYTGSLASGIYILHVKSGGKELYKKIILK